ncbi:MAG: uncharacterized protein H6Q07_2194 [Acidobacteria bacterium]|jgi:hypothetical protein|nr:uncharacterized protein [Acidobacteriota bacterium]
MIIETIFSTLDKAGNPNFAPMGIEWDEGAVIVRPFRTSQTFRNLQSSGCGVANMSDNVLAFVRCALYKEVLPSFPAIAIRGSVFRDTCSWVELAVDSGGGTEERAEFRCRILHRGRQKDFLGICRAKNAVIESAILGTRLAIHGRQKALEFLSQYVKIVEKAGSEEDKEAFKLVCDFVEKQGGQ